MGLGMASNCQYCTFLQMPCLELSYCPEIPSLTLVQIVWLSHAQWLLQQNTDWAVHKPIVTSQLQSHKVLEITTSFTMPFSRMCTKHLAMKRNRYSRLQIRNMVSVHGIYVTTYCISVWGECLSGMFRMQTVWVKVFTGRAGFVIYLEEVWLGAWTDAWVSDSLANAASLVLNASIVPIPRARLTSTKEACYVWGQTVAAA